MTRATDTAPLAETLARYAPHTELVEMGYQEGYPILDGIR